MFPSLKGFNRGPAADCSGVQSVLDVDVSIPQRVQPWPRRDVFGVGRCTTGEFPSLKGFNRGPDRMSQQRALAMDDGFPSLKGFNRGPDMEDRHGYAKDSFCFHPSKGSTVAQTLVLAIVLLGGCKSFHPSKGSTVAQTKQQGLLWLLTNFSFHPSKGSTVAQTSHRLLSFFELGQVSIPQRVQPWPRPTGTVLRQHCV